MKTKNKIISVDAMMDERFGKVGTPEREAFRREAYNYCVGKFISEARKRERYPNKNWQFVLVLTGIIFRK